MQNLHKQYTSETQAYDVDEILRLNRVFHLRIYSDANMPILQRIIEGLWDQISPYFHILLRDAYFPYNELNTRNHGRMLEGLQRKDVKESVKWLQTDLNEAANLISLEFERGKQ